MSSAIPVATSVDSAWAVRLPASPADDAKGTVAATPASQGGAVLAPDALAVAVQKINDAMQGPSVGVRFEVDGETDRLVVKVVDRDSGELIRQMPSEEVLRLAKVLGQAPGTLVSHTA